MCSGEIYGRVSWPHRSDHADRETGDNTTHESEVVKQCDSAQELHTSYRQERHYHRESGASPVTRVLSGRVHNPRERRW